MKPFLVVVLFVSALNSLYAQTGKLSGRVTDAKTGGPLPFSNVYVNNTTLGVTTNSAGEFTMPNLPAGPTEVVFSFIGYSPQHVKVIVNETVNPSLVIQLMPDAQQIGEVQVKAGRDKTWEKHLRRFEKAFLGNTAQCLILNPWVIDFVNEKEGMTAQAALPLEIENRSLGYRLFFQLKKFSYSATEFSIIGSIRFTELETSEAAVALEWTKNRERAYRGSVKHLMKSILDDQLRNQGFELYSDKVKGKLRSDNFSTELRQNLFPYDAASQVASNPGSNVYRIAMNDRIEVHYTNEFTTTNFYKDISHPVSWLQVRGGSVLVNREGTLLNPTDVTLSGTMADTRTSSMLPLDYRPGSLIVAQSSQSLLAKRLQENVYLHTDKPYYYPGDNLWFSAYMHYRLPALRDTLSKVLYVDLINADRIITQSRILKIDEGRAAGSFRLPAAIPPGPYVLRAYTQWMRNYGIDQFFYKPINVLSFQEQADGSAPKPVSDSQLHLTLDQPAYKKRSPVNLTLRLDTTGLDFIQSSFSVAVLDETSAVPVAEPSSIKTAFVFAEPSAGALTAFSYPVERGLTMAGTYKDKKGKEKKETLTFVPQNLAGIYQAATGSNGAFSLTNLSFYDSTKFVVQPAGGTVVLSYPDPPTLPAELPQFKLPLRPLQTPRVPFSADTTQARLLQEVKVSARKAVQSENAYAQADISLKGETLERFASAAEAIAASIPGFKLVSEQATWFLVWTRGSLPTSSAHTQASLFDHEPNLYIDNVQVMGLSAGERLMQLNPTMIDHIEVNGMITANQGANGSNGLINVYTKRPAQAPSTDLLFVKVRGFDHEVPFQSPDYATPVTKATPADTRSTLYWNPRVQLSPPRTAVTLSFFTADQPGTYRVIVEGVTSLGNPIRSEARLIVTD